MARLARIVVPGLPHHVTQRGNRREAIFFEDGDHEVYLDLLAEQTLKAGVSVWAYCRMPNHVHLILKPGHADDLGRAVGEAHRRSTNFIDTRGRWTGHLFQSRFASVVLDGLHLIRAESTGRPLGAPEFVISLESLLGRKIARHAPGRKPEMQSTDAEQLELL